MHAGNREEYKDRCRLVIVAFPDIMIGALTRSTKDTILWTGGVLCTKSHDPFARMIQQPDADLF